MVARMVKMAGTPKQRHRSGAPARHRSELSQHHDSTGDIYPPDLRPCRGVAGFEKNGTAATRCPAISLALSWCLRRRWKINGDTARLDCSFAMNSWFQWRGLRVACRRRKCAAASALPRPVMSKESPECVFRSMSTNRRRDPSKSDREFARQSTRRLVFSLEVGRTISRAWPINAKICKEPGRSNFAGPWPN